jgi:CxxC-x17-CxxC domain-containing protein
MMYGGYRDNSDRPKEYFKATCSDCGKECEVPFKPTQGRPVYCRDCFRKHKPEERDRSRF